MAGVGGLSSLGLFLLLLLASSSAAREERSSRTGWEPVTQGAFKYLVLLNVTKVAKCSGSIPSKWTVLTYCKDATDDGNTKAYAGMLAVADADPDKTGVQERVVKKVTADGPLENLKICTLEKIWDLNGHVTSIAPSGSGETCTVLGFRADTSTQKVVLQKLDVTIPATGDCSFMDKNDQFGSLIEADKALAQLDFGGPVVCGGAQRGINKEYQDKPKSCNVYIEIKEYSPWIADQIKAAEESGESGGTGGTGGNGTSPSSGYSIHSYVNKYSNWKVLAFLVPTIVTFLQY